MVIISYPLEIHDVYVSFKEHRSLCGSTMYLTCITGSDLGRACIYILPTVSTW